MSWPQVKLGSVFEIARGGSPRPIDDYITDADDGLNWVSIRDASNSNKFIETTRLKIKPEGLSKTRLVKPGDFLLTNSMSFGRPYIMKTTGCIHDGWLVLSGDPEIVDADYFYHLLGSDLLKHRFSALAAGAVVKNLNIDLVKGVEIPLPPLSEQKRIAAILDKADSIRCKRQDAIQLADDFLRAAFLDMFGDPVTNPKGWPVNTLGAVTKDWRGGASITPEDFTDSGFPVLHKGAIQKQGRIIVDGSKKTFVSGDFAYRKKSSLVKNNCIAITLRDLVPSGPSIGLMADLSDYDADTYLLSQGAYGFAVEPGIAHAAYLVALSNHDGFREAFRKISVGSTQIHIRSSDVKSLSLPVPPIKLQSEYGNLRSAMMACQKKAASAGDDDLLFSLAQKAFSGQI